jgi:hypothetical protein
MNGRRGRRAVTALLANKMAATEGADADGLLTLRASSDLSKRT